MTNENIGKNLNLPVYNIKAVSRLVGLLPVTLRAWERRYGIPRPGRGDQGYRLYSEHDVRTLRWLKTQSEAGLSISRAIDYLNELRMNGQDPVAEPTYQLPVYPVQVASPTLDSLSEQLSEALIHFDEPAAQDAMRRAFALYSVDQVLWQVLQPILVKLGDAWHRGELPIAVEHYANQFCMQHLMSMLSAAASPVNPGTIVAACAPGEQHQVGILMLVIMLRWRGWNVKYLGPDLPIDRLEEALQIISPQILMFSANRVETAEKLSRLPEILSNFPQSQPIVILGGRAFQTMRLPDSVPAIYLNASPHDTVQRIEEIMRHAIKSLPRS